MRITLNWRRPLLYLYAPVFVFMIFVGFPPPLAPPHKTKPAQEQSVVKKTQTQKRREAGDSSY